MQQNMYSITVDRPTKWLFITIAAYFVMNGAQVFETAILVPAWTASPPNSLRLFHEPYHLDFKIFWIVVHSLHEITFIAAIVYNWNLKQRRNVLLTLFVAHFLVRVWTLVYFAPTIMWFQSLSVSDTIDQQLVDKASLWRNLNYLRVGLFLLINLLLVYVLKNRKSDQYE